MSPTMDYIRHKLHARAEICLASRFQRLLPLLLLLLLVVVPGGSSSKKNWLIQRAELKYPMIPICLPVLTRSVSKSFQTLFLISLTTSAAIRVTLISHWSRLRPKILNRPIRGKGAHLSAESSPSRTLREAISLTGAVGLTYQR